ncbi:MAG: energy transducer TonB [Deltaproteobacteria bacterium]|nr:energy transducer TonB [Deltaproteobacteria bacterium]
MRRIIRRTAIALLGIASFACQQDGPPPPSESAEIQGIQVATDAYVAYQHADCETVYRLTRPDLLAAMQATELRYSLRLVRGFCQELDGDQPAARATYREAIQEAPTSFAAADARERIRILDLLADDPGFLERVERAAQGPHGPSGSREPAERPPALYPPLARAAGIEGFAVVEFGVDPAGRTVDPIIVDSEPPFLFEATALRAVRGWEYKTKRKADPSQRHVIRIAFRTAVEPVLVDEEPGTSSARPPETD